MTAGFFDRRLLQSIRPLDVGAYLRTRAWKESEVDADVSTTWVRKHAGEEFEVLLPLKSDLRDFTARITQLVETLSQVESRSAGAVIRDLLTSGVDVIRVQVPTREGGDSLDIEGIVGLYGGSRDWILAGACAAARPAAAYPTRKPPEAMEYIKKVRAGQTESGSFVATFLSPVAPALLTFEPDSPLPPVEEPFERRAVLTLANATHAATRAARESTVHGSFEPFERTIVDGVSANLCGALAEIAQEIPDARKFRIDITWSRNRPFLQNAPSTIEVPRDVIPAFEEATRILQSRREEDSEVEGYVVKLEGQELGFPGRVTVFGEAAGKFRNVRMDLTAEQYGVAYAAHGGGEPVVAQGRLVKNGKIFSLQEIRRFVPATAFDASLPS